ncbi:hypothetical protein ACLKA6_004922 [Drosophila palustris]
MEGEQERELGMQQNHRNHILRNIDNLIRNTSYLEIMNETVARGLLSTRMRQEIENPYNMSQSDVLHEQHKRYFEKITKRGPRAYEVLKDIMRSKGFVEALRILESVEDYNSGLPYVSLSQMHRNNNNTSNNSQSHSNNISSQNHNNNNNSNNKSTDIVDTRIKSHNNEIGSPQPYTEPVEGQTRVVIKSDRIHKDEVVGHYTMQSQHDRGVLLVVNVIEFWDPKKLRSGAEGDGKSLIHIFREIGFTIFYQKNLNQDEFFKYLRAVTKSEYVRRAECFVMALMTHGERVDEKDRVLFSDGSIIEVKTIVDHFQADNCPYLRDKPKVLILPFCRGERLDPGKSQFQRMPTQTDGMPPYINVPTLSDLLLCYASTAGYETHRDPKDGSWYIQQFCDTMAEHAHNLSLEDILKKTQLKVGNMRTPEGTLQTGEYNSRGFNKKLFFNPGFYLDPNTAK